jgi:hypothetical protein
MQPLAVLRLERFDGRWRKLRFGIAERADGAPGVASAPAGSRCRASLARRKRRMGSISSVGAEWCGPPSNGSIRSS